MASAAVSPAAVDSLLELVRDHHLETAHRLARTQTNWGEKVHLIGQSSNLIQANKHVLMFLCQNYMLFLGAHPGQCLACCTALTPHCMHTQANA